MRCFRANLSSGQPFRLARNTELKVPGVCVCVCVGGGIGRDRIRSNQHTPSALVSFPGLSP